VAQKKGRKLKSLAKTLAPAREGDVLELDEAWSYVGKKSNKRWLWTALCRRTGQVVAFAIGDRSADTCARLWKKIPEDYRQCRSFSDFWDAYASVFSSDTHEQVDKKSGETSHMERFYCTLRQRLARYVRKTLSFSKSERMHHLVTRWFIGLYNEAVT
jgi:IS1 family transposase